MVKFVRILCGLALISVLGGCAGNPPQASDPSPTTPTAESSPAPVEPSPSASTEPTPVATPEPSPVASPKATYQGKRITYGEIAQKFKALGMNEQAGGHFVKELQSNNDNVPHGITICEAQVNRKDSVPAYESQHVVDGITFDFRWIALLPDGRMQSIAGSVWGYSGPVAPLFSCWEAMAAYNSLAYEGDMNQLRQIVTKGLRMIYNHDVVGQDPNVGLWQQFEEVPWGRITVLLGGNRVLVTF